MGTWTETDPRIAVVRSKVTDRAGRDVRAVSEVARQLGCDWHTVMDAVVAYGTPLVDAPDRIGTVTALGLDETLFVRKGRWRTRNWCTSIVDVSRPSQLLAVALPAVRECERVLLWGGLVELESQRVRP